ncbi:hypothetical protein [Bacillus cereus group sp. BfR-BA-01424]|uniref:hypothetical protein n=1 Tax=unclassified Bacillus cereus group TaxID=2750818 RepID=UPI001F5AC09E
MLPIETKNLKMINYLEYMEFVAKTNMKYLKKEITAEEAMEIICDLSIKVAENLEKLK